MKKLFKVFSIIMVMFLISACQRDENIDTNVTSTVSITHKLGTTKVPINPEKVVVLDFGAMDIMDNIGVGDKMIGISKGSTVEYLSSYFEDENIIDLGSLKEINMEKLNEINPDLIIIGGRQSDNYEEFLKIAPTILVNIDNELGYMNSFERNLNNIATIFEKTDMVNIILDDFNNRIATLKEKANNTEAIVALVNKGSINTLGKASRGSIISNEIGFSNLTDTNSTHGDNVSFEFLLEKNPEYIFVIDRDVAIATSGAKLAKEIVENDIVKKSMAYQNNNIIYLTSSVWYLAEGGIESTNIMLQDLENGILK